MRRRLGAVLAGLALGIAPAVLAQPAGLDPQLLKPNLVEVDTGVRLNIACVGKGSPTVVFEQDETGSIASWRKVAAETAALTRTCVYDRAGLGYSDPTRDAVDGIHVGDDLRRLLLAADVRGPVVLVGQGIGGFYATLYADRFPQQVAGLVLVDPAYAGQPAASGRARKRELQARSKEIQRLKGCAELARQDALTAEAPKGCFSLAPDLGPDAAAYELKSLTRPSWYAASAEQMANFYPAGGGESLDWRQERLARRPFGDLPMVVISASAPARPAGLNDKAYAEFASRWKEGHRTLAARSSRGEWREAAGAGPAIALDQPQAVSEAIRKVVAEARETGAGAAAKPAKGKAVKGKAAKVKASKSKAKPARKAP